MEEYVNSDFCPIDVSDEALRRIDKIIGQALRPRSADKSNQVNEAEPSHVWSAEFTTNIVTSNKSLDEILRFSDEHPGTVVEYKVRQTRGTDDSIYFRIKPGPEGYWSVDLKSDLEQLMEFKQRFEELIGELKAKPKPSDTPDEAYFASSSDEIYVSAEWLRRIDSAIGNLLTRDVSKSPTEKEVSDISRL